jgi:Bacterial SH3 domain
MSSSPGPAGSGEERTVSYQPEERYWTDYLRIALPVLGLLLLIGLLWYWASALIGNGSEQPPVTPQLAAVITPVNEATPAPPTATAVVIAPTPGPPPTPTPTPAPPTPTRAAAATVSSGATSGENPCANLPTYAVGDTVKTTADVNLREGPTTDSAAITILPAGTQLEITGNFEEAGQCDWWPVKVVSSGQTGFVIEQYLAPASS